MFVDFVCTTNLCFISVMLILLLGIDEFVYLHSFAMVQMLNVYIEVFSVRLCD